MRTLLTALAILWFLAGALAGRTLATTPRPAPVPAASSNALGTSALARTEAPRAWVRPVATTGASPTPGRNAQTLAPTATVGVPAPLSGVASWYAYVEGQAAAGPALRRFLGPHWRYMTVRVCAATCEWIRLTDWMQADRLIDLDSRSWAAICGLALSRGLCRVVVG